MSAAIWVLSGLLVLNLIVGAVERLHAKKRLYRLTLVLQTLITVRAVEPADVDRALKSVDLALKHPEGVPDRYFFPTNVPKHGSLPCE